MRKLFLFPLICIGFLLITFSCSDDNTSVNNPSGDTNPKGYTTVREYTYCCYVDENSKWDENSRELRNIIKFDGKTFKPEKLYLTIFGKAIMLNLINKSFSKGLSDVLKWNFRKLGNVLTVLFYKNDERNYLYEYIYDNKGYLVKINGSENNELILSNKYSHINGKLQDITFEGRDGSVSTVNFEYGNNGFVSNMDYKIGYSLYKFTLIYDNNDYLTEVIGRTVDCSSVRYKYKYNNIGLLIEKLFLFCDQEDFLTFVKYQYNESKFITIDHPGGGEYMTIFFYDDDNYLIESIYYQNDIPYRKYVYEYSK